MEPTKPRPFSPSNKNETPKEWKRWKQEFLIYLRLSGGYDDYSEEERALFLQNLMGIEAIKAMEKISFDHENETKDMDILLMKFDEIFDPPSNEVEERFKFFSRRKNEKETIDDYVSDLEKIASNCNFGQQTNNFILDMIIRSMDMYMRKSVFTLQDVTLSDVIVNYKISELNNQKIKKLSQDMVQDVNLENIKEKKLSVSSAPSLKKARSKNYCLKCQSYHGVNTACKKEPTMDEYLKQKRTCSKCGSNHPYMQCPAFDTICQNCFEKGHYTNKCKKRSNMPPQDSQVFSSSATRKKEEYCDWCELSHLQGQCQHNTNCTTCDAFPHKICFNCKKNPHDLICYYKDIVSLPSKFSMNNKKNTGKQLCTQCGFQHEANKCVITKNEDTTGSQNSNSDPLIRNYVKVNRTSTFNPTSFPDQRKTFSTTKNPPQSSFKPTQKKNDKNDCCIS